MLVPLFRVTHMRDQTLAAGEGVLIDNGRYTYIHASLVFRGRESRDYAAEITGRRDGDSERRIVSCTRRSCPVFDTTFVTVLYNV